MTPPRKLPVARRHRNIRAALVWINVGKHSAKNPGTESLMRTIDLVWAVLRRCELAEMSVTDARKAIENGDVDVLRYVVELAEAELR